MKPWIVVSETKPYVMGGDGKMYGRRRWLIACGIVSIGGVPFGDIPIIKRYGLFGRYDDGIVAIRPDLEITDFIWQKG